MERRDVTPDDERAATPLRAAERMQDEPATAAGSPMLDALEAAGYPTVRSTYHARCVT